MAISTPRRGVLFGLCAAVLFGASTPIAKDLLDDVSPQLLAGLLYLGAFVALGAALPARRRSHEARVRRADVPRLVALVVTGGVAAPVLLLVGLERLSGTSASLLLNLEGPFTLLLGLVVFGEHLSRRPMAGAAVIFAAAAFLTGGTGTGAAELVGVLCVVGACALWGIDNNLTQSLTTRDPVVIVVIKSGAAASVNIALALLFGAGVPGWPVIGVALVVGALSYGLSILLDAYALRVLGAAREAAIFATAPFAGAVLAVPILSESLGTRELLAGLAMAFGVALMLVERHDHMHAHDALEHDHLHTHDEHHRHAHQPGVDSTAPHSHPHRHEGLAHSHTHVSDAHHRHRH